MHAGCFGFRELKSVLIDPLLKTIETPLNLTVNYYYTFRTETYTKVIDIQRTSHANWPGMGPRPIASYDQHDVTGFFLHDFVDR